MKRGPGTPTPTRDDMDPYMGCILTARDPSTARAAAAPGTSSATTTSAGEGGREDAHKSEQSLLSFVRSDLYCHVNGEKVEAM